MNNNANHGSNTVEEKSKKVEFEFINWFAGMHSINWLQVIEIPQKLSESYVNRWMTQNSTLRKLTIDRDHSLSQIFCNYSQLYSNSLNIVHLLTWCWIHRLHLTVLNTNNICRRRLCHLHHPKKVFFLVKMLQTIDLFIVFQFEFRFIECICTTHRFTPAHTFGKIFFVIFCE